MLFKEFSDQVAHLAGAMGIPTWILTAHSPDWRYHLQRSDHPWYSSVRLFRQERDGDWSGAISAVATELSRLVARLSPGLAWGRREFQAATSTSSRVASVCPMAI